MSMVTLLENGLKYLGLAHPPTGRMIAENGDAVNIAEFIRSLPISIARGAMPGAQPFGSYGERIVAGSEADVPIWPNGLIVKLPDAGAQLVIASNDPEDSATGTNVRTVEIHYLDGMLDQQIETIILNGIADVLTEARDIRWIQCMHLTTFGVNAFAAGTITATFGSDVYSQINPLKIRCSSSFRMIPRGKVLYIGGAVGSSVSSTADAHTLMSIVASELDNHTYHDPLILIPHAGIGLQNGALGFTFPPGLRFSEGTLVGGTHTTNKAAIVTMSWFGHIENAPGVEPEGHEHG